MGIDIKEKNNQSAKKVVGTQIPQSLYAQLKDEAEADFMSVSDLLRKIIYLYYRKESKSIDVVERNIENE